MTMPAMPPLRATITKGKDDFTAARKLLQERS